MSTGSRYGGVLDRGEIGFDMDMLTWAHWVAVLLAAVTGGVHVYLFVNEGFLPFLFAGVVFFGAIVALLLNVYRKLLYALGIPFTAGQIALWAAFGMPNMEIAIIDKPAQVLLILLLVFLFLNEDELTAGR